MTWYITAHENTRARLIASETRTTDEALVAVIVAALEARGFIVAVRSEG
jgi:hypothetical protein